MPTALDGRLLVEERLEEPDRLRPLVGHLDVVVVVDEDRLRIRLVRGAERLGDVVLADGAKPGRRAEEFVGQIAQSLVDHVPLLDLALEVTDNSGNVVAHPLQRQLAARQPAVRPLEEPARGLRVPDETVADGVAPHLRAASTMRSPRSKVNLPSSGSVASGFMPFPQVNALKWRIAMATSMSGLSGRRREIERRADQELALEGILERRHVPWLAAVVTVRLRRRPRRGERSQQSDQDSEFS